MTQLTTKDWSPTRQAAYRLLEKQMEKNGNRYAATVEEQLDILEERGELEQLWRLAGYGDPPPFTPSSTAGARRVLAS